ncbi:hypothetical protein BD414DRAFT_418021 [Trametes punicea]|nr:hypothetical protein BD414DRAFT_418021 [Trametes punicea]
MRLGLPATLKNPCVSLVRCSPVTCRVIHDRKSVRQTSRSLCQLLLKAWFLAWPLVFRGGRVVMNYWRDQRDARGIIFWVQLLCTRVREGLQPRYRRYRSAEEEEDYWKSSEKTRLYYQVSDANSTPANVPLVRYYTPKLLPRYREPAGADPEGTECALSPRAFCKWHMMVFRGPLHPTPKEAARQIRYYSSRDRREIYRISRLLTDDDVFSGKGQWTMRYAAMWKRWLNTKGPDLAIVFE